MHRVPLAFVVVTSTGLAGSLLGGCPSPLCEVKDPLVDGEAWSFVEPAADPLWPAPEGAALCDADAIQRQAFDDDVAVEIDTRFGCGWATVEQRILVGVAAGDELQVRIFHFSQSTFPEAEAEVAIALDDEIVLRQRVAIPSTSGLIAPRLTVAGDHPAGTIARFHIGNHGDNSWNLIELARLGTGVCPAATE